MRSCSRPSGDRAPIRTGCPGPHLTLLEAKSNLSRLVEAVETGAEAEIIIARNGRPVARRVAIGSAPLGQRIGVARGAFVVPDSIDINNDEVEYLFHGTDP